MSTSPTPEPRRGAMRRVNSWDVLKEPTIVTAHHDIRLRFIVIRAPSLGAPAILQRVEWDSDNAQWKKIEGSVPFSALPKWQLVRPGLVTSKTAS